MEGSCHPRQPRKRRHGTGKESRGSKPRAGGGWARPTSQNQGGQSTTQLTHGFFTFHFGSFISE